LFVCLEGDFDIEKHLIIRNTKTKTAINSNLPNHIFIIYTIFKLAGINVDVTPQLKPTFAPAYIDSNRACIGGIPFNKPAIVPTVCIIKYKMIIIAEDLTILSVSIFSCK